MHLYAKEGAWGLLEQNPGDGTIFQVDPKRVHVFCKMVAMAMGCLLFLWVWVAVIYAKSQAYKDITLSVM